MPPTSLSRRTSLTGLAIVAFAVSACGGRAVSVPPSAPHAGADGAAGSAVSAPHSRRKVSPITHVVLLIQENRSFDYLFQGYPNADTRSYGLAVPLVAPTCAASPVPGATPATIPLEQIPLEAAWDMYHDHRTWLNAYDDQKMDGFNRECLVLGNNPTPPPSQYPNPQFGYAPQSEVQPYWDMAGQYVVADEMFQTNIDGSYVAHQYLIAGQADREVDYPTSLWGCPGPPSSDTIRQLLPDPNPSHLLDPSSPIPVCEDYQTLADEFDTAGLTWKVYAPKGPPQKNESIPSDWNGFQAIDHIYNGPDWATDVVTPQNKVLKDIKAGNLPNMTWIIPSWADSDHPINKSKKGPHWIASVVNAIGKNQQLWNSTVVLVTWDDWGGWYDHVVPQDIDFDGLGFRVPLLMISAYTPAGVIAHKQLEFGSILRYVENTFGLGQLAASDTRATPVDQGCTASVLCIDPSRTPRPFKKIKTAYPESVFLNEKPDGHPVDTQ